MIPMPFDEKTALCGAKTATNQRAERDSLVGSSHRINFQGHSDWPGQ